MAKYLDLDGLSHFKTKCDSLYATKGEISSLLKFKGSVAFANLPSLQTAAEGDVYNVNNDFVTTNDFVEGAGKSCSAGTNVVVVTISSVKKWDVLGGTISVDFTNLSTSVIPAVTNSYNLGSAQKVWNLVLGKYIEAATSVTTPLITTSGNNEDISIEPDGTGKVISSADVIPSATGTKDLGSSNKCWNNLYLSGYLTDNLGTELSISEIAALPNTSITDNEIDALFA